MGTIILSSQKSWIEGEAVRQLEKTAELPGMVLGVGMPDLHPGKGHPIGAAFITRGIFYPYLIGNDIGCGMALYQTDQLTHKVKLDRLVKEDLEKTALGSRVICEDKDLMFEEAPQAYKKVEQVIADLVDHGLIEVVAKLRPMVTYKTRRPS